MANKSLVVPHENKDKDKTNEIVVAVLSFIVFIISCYYISLTLCSDQTDKSITFLQIGWRIATIAHLLTSLFGYIGAVLKIKRVLIITVGLTLIDLLLSLGVYWLSYNKMSSQYSQHLSYLANMINRTVHFEDRDCDFVKVFPRTIIETLIALSYHILFLSSVINLLHSIDKSQKVVIHNKSHPKWPIVLLSAFHIFYAIYLFWSKIFPDDHRDEILAKKHFLHIFSWSLLALLSIITAILAPFAVLKVKQNMFLLNFFISIVMSSTLLAFSKFLIILYREVSSDPENDYYCNVRLTSVDNLCSISALMIINKIIIASLLGFKSNYKESTTLKVVN